MRQIKPYLCVAWLLVLVVSCIESFVPEIDEELTGQTVVLGEVTSDAGYQYLRITLSSPIDNPSNQPLSDCSVIIEDDLGHSFQGEEYSPGNYRVWIDGIYLVVGTAYRTRIITSTGELLVSDFEVMPAGPPVDSVFYERIDFNDLKPGEDYPGYQFYANLKAIESDSRFYRWSLEETYQYEVPYPLQDYYDGQIRHLSIPDYSRKVCWKTTRLGDIITLSTNGLADNEYNRLPLNFVDNTSARLYEGYSLLVSQFALSERAYNFWEKLRVNLEQQGGLYEKQPLRVEGNLSSITYPNRRILGYFGASSVSRKRLFIEGVKDLGIVPYTCLPEPLGRFGWAEYTPADYPVYIVYVNERLRVVDNACVDCTRIGGLPEKPEYWIW